MVQNHSYLEIHYPVVVEILSREDVILDTRRVEISERVLVNVPAAKAEVQSADESHFVVNDHELLVVRPVERHVRRILKDVVIRMPHDDNVPVARGPLRAEVVKSALRVARVAGNSRLDLAVDADIDLDAGLGLALEDVIQTPLLILVWRPAEEELGAEPPVGEIDGLLGALERLRHGPEVIAAVDVPFDQVVVADREERFVAVFFRDVVALLVAALLVLLVMAMFRVPLVGRSQ